MSDSAPVPDDHTAPVAAPKRSRRGLVFVLVAFVLVVGLGGAAYAAYEYLNGGGPRPEDALPANTVAVASIDLDPKAGQKIEAIKTFRKFPALRENLGIESQDDVRRYIVDKGISPACGDVDYDRDVKPWIGERAAVAAVDLGDEYPAPALVLQVSDPVKAERGFEELVRCGEGELPGDVGWAIGDDYLIASDSDAHAKEILSAGEREPLTDDKAYQRWSDEIGDKGIVNFYVAPGAGQYFGEIFDTALSDLGPDFVSGFAEGLQGAQGSPGEDPVDTLKEGFEDFAGAAGTVRFVDAGMELVVATESDAADDFEGGTVGRAVAALPADTALAVGLAVPEKAIDSLFEGIRSSSGGETFVAEAEQRAGLTLPEDLKKLLGEAITVSVGGDAPSLDDLEDPERVPVGVTLHGQPREAQEVIRTVEERLGVRLADIPVHVETSDDVLAMSPSSAYAEELTQDGNLGDDDLFRRAVPDAEHAQGVFFLTIDGGWRDSITDLAAGELSERDLERLRENLEPFSAFGLSTTVDDGVSRFQLRIATD